MRDVTVGEVAEAAVTINFFYEEGEGGRHLPVVRDVEVRNLSHGEQRQIEIVLGLASDPAILLLDEPAAGLSSGESQEMAGFLKRLDPGLAILMIEHDMDVVFGFADHISVLHFGEVVEEGATEKIRSSEKVREIYLGTG